MTRSFIDGFFTAEDFFKPDSKGEAPLLDRFVSALGRDAAEKANAILREHVEKHGVKVFGNDRCGANEKQWVFGTQPARDDKFSGFVVEVREIQKMRFKATKDQILQIAANATNASKPVGLGVLHFDADQKFGPGDFELYVDMRGKDALSLDYVGGRMVKLHIMNVGGDTWEMRDTIDPAYQSWFGTYRTVKELIRSVIPEEKP